MTSPPSAAGSMGPAYAWRSCAGATQRSGSPPGITGGPARSPACCAVSTCWSPAVRAAMNRRRSFAAPSRRWSSRGSTMASRRPACGGASSAANPGTHGPRGRAGAGSADLPGRSALGRLSHKWPEDVAHALGSPLGHAVSRLPRKSLTMDSVGAGHLPGACPARPSPARVDRRRQDRRRYRLVAGRPRLGHRERHDIADVGLLSDPELRLGILGQPARELKPDLEFAHGSGFQGGLEHVGGASTGQSVGEHGRLGDGAPNGYCTPVFTSAAVASVATGRPRPVA